MDHGISTIPGSNRFVELAIFLGMRLGILNHVLDLRIRQTRTGLDFNLLLFARSVVFSTHMHDGIGIDIECYFDLRHTTHGRGNTCQVKACQ